MPGHERPMPNSRWEERVKYEEIIHKCHILNKLPVRTNVSMEIWRKKTRITRMLQCLPSTIWSVLKNAAFLIRDSAADGVTVSSSLRRDTLQCPFEISHSESCSGLCQCSFSIASVWMMRFSSLRSLAWKVHCSAAWHSFFFSFFFLLKMSSPSILWSRSGTNCWPQIKYCTGKKEELWHSCCHAAHLTPCCALGPILLWNWTNWCLEMHPAAVLKHSEQFVSIL